MPARVVQSTINGEITEGYLKDKKVSVKNVASDDDNDDMQSLGSTMMIVAMDCKGSGSNSGSPSDSDSDSSGAKAPSDASGDITLTRDAKKGKNKVGNPAKNKAVASAAGSDADESRQSRAKIDTQTQGFCFSC
ncbi:hypothetical protein BYT27DRAFT_7206249 [Phlegmacium glaucopus]|nr:hypothetical protein BYT27DRAFT_7206249 [Phlegmacium glaucopus]